jgi:hypothetical protein
MRLRGERRTPPGMHRRGLLIVAGATVAAMVVATAVIAVGSLHGPAVGKVVTVSANAPYPDVPPTTPVATAPPTWKFHADYCGVIQGELWTGVGTFTLTAPGGAALTGTFTDSARLPSTGVPYELDITGGTKRLARASGSCVLENHLKVVQFGVQQQFGSVVRDFRG